MLLYKLIIVQMFGQASTFKELPVFKNPFF